MAPGPSRAEAELFRWRAGAALFWHAIGALCLLLYYSWVSRALCLVSSLVPGAGSPACDVSLASLVVHLFPAQILAGVAHLLLLTPTPLPPLWLPGRPPAWCPHAHFFAASALARLRRPGGAAQTLLAWSLLWASARAALHAVDQSQVSMQGLTATALVAAYLWETTFSGLHTLPPPPLLPRSRWMRLRASLQRAVPLHTLRGALGALSAASAVVALELSGCVDTLSSSAGAASNPLLPSASAAVATALCALGAALLLLPGWTLAGVMLRTLCSERLLPAHYGEGGLLSARAAALQAGSSAPQPDACLATRVFRRLAWQEVAAASAGATPGARSFQREVFSDELGEAWLALARPCAQQLAALSREISLGPGGDKPAAAAGGHVAPPVPPAGEDLRSVQARAAWAAGRAPAAWNPGAGAARRHARPSPAAVLGALGATAERFSDAAAAARVLACLAAAAAREDAAGALQLSQLGAAEVAAALAGALEAARKLARAARGGLRPGGAAAARAAWLAALGSGAGGERWEAYDRECRPPLFGWLALGPARGGGEGVAHAGGAAEALVDELRACLALLGAAYGGGLREALQERGLGPEVARTVMECAD